MLTLVPGLIHGREYRGTRVSLTFRLVEHLDHRYPLGEFLDADTRREAVRRREWWAHATSEKVAV